MRWHYQATRPRCPPQIGRQDRRKPPKTPPTRVACLFPWEQVPVRCLPPSKQQSTEIQKHRSTELPPANSRSKHHSSSGVIDLLSITDEIAEKNRSAKWRNFNSRLPII